MIGLATFAASLLLAGSAGHLKAADELSHFLQAAHGGGENDALKLATQADETVCRGDEVDGRAATG